MYWNSEISEDSAALSGTINQEYQTANITVKSCYYFLDTLVTEEYEEFEENVFCGDIIDSETGDLIDGAEFELYTDEKCTEAAEDIEIELEEGEMEIHFTEAGTFYLKEISAPTGYHLSEKVYTLEVEANYSTVLDGDNTIVVKNLMGYTEDLTKADELRDELYEVYEIPHTQIKQITLSAEKKWIVPDGYTNIPAYAQIQLYRDGVVYGDPIKLNKDNQWKYKWSGKEYTDLYEWEIKEINVPLCYDSKVITEDGVNVIFENTLKYNYTTVSVSKIWLNPKGYTQQPTSVTVVLYRDGVAYSTVKLSKDNKWSYKWSDLPDCFEWTVDEPEVPKEYAKKITHIGNAWVITNAHKDIPLTGDDSPVLLWAGATGVAVIGLGACLFLLLKKRKKEDDAE